MIEILRQRGFLFNILLLCYLLFVQPHLLGLIHSTENLGQPHYALGFAMIAINLLDLAGYYLKSPPMFCRIMKIDPKADMSFGVFLLWMGHSVLGVGLVIIALHAFGITSEAAQFAAYLLAVVKELAVLGLLWSGKSSGSPEHHSLREIFGDFFILIFAAVAFSSTWTFITVVQGEHIAGNNIAMTIVNIIPATILFLFFFLPVRMPYLIEEWYTTRTDAGRLSIIGTIAANVAAALWFAW